MTDLIWGNSEPSFQPPENRETNHFDEMAKKRDHQRPAPSPGRRENQIKSSSRREKRTEAHSPSGAIKVAAFFIVSSVIAIAVYWLRQSSLSQHNRSYVYQRGLVTTDTNFQDILTVSIAITTLWIWFYHKLFEFFASKAMFTV